MTKINGVSSLLMKIEALGGNAEKSLMTGVRQAGKRVQSVAKQLAPVDKGDLRNRIYERTKKKGTKIQSRVFTNVEHAPYVEFGTGPIGEDNKHLIADSMKSKISYRQDPWWIHESMIDKRAAEKYKFPKIETDEGIFYFSHGQPAQPYLYPAMAQSEKVAVGIIKKKLQEDLKKLRGR